MRAPRDNARDEKTRADEKRPLPGEEAAKFREETPRKGGGFAGRTRDTALQQNRGTWFPQQAQKRRSGLHFPSKIKIFYRIRAGFCANRA